ncbi:MAG: acyl esterase [Alphaproteobacteria bacterium]|nr:acyl esterase [Alphaproteobacteria bacterium]
MASSSDMPAAVPARSLSDGAGGQLAYTIATLVTDPGQYEAMRASFAAGGFAPLDCEYLFVDNTGFEQTCAYTGLNQALRAARGRHVILCHQDIRLIPGGDSRRELDARLAELDGRDPDWAVAGNAGGLAPGRLSVRISDPHGRDQRVGDFPARVVSLDENFIVVRRSANLSFSRNLAGFHFYATDLCLVADMLGWNAYVIDFHIEHLSPGNARSRDFEARKEEFRAKWSKALRPRWIQTTCALLRLDGEPLRQLVGQLLEEPVRKLSRRLPGASGWTGGEADTREARGSQPATLTPVRPTAGPGNDEAA